MRLEAHYYQQFDADLSRDVPAEAFGGWRSDTIEISAQHTALVVMHAWDTGSPEQFPGWYRSVEYLSRANRIGQEVLPGLLEAVRASGMTVLHVVGGGEYYKDLPGYRRAAALAAPEPPPPPKIEADPALEELRRFRQARVSPGTANQSDVQRGMSRLSFMPAAAPRADEGIAENAGQLFALCRQAGVNHLVYVGFAINWCLLMSPGGMVDMERRGFLCSTIREAVTAVESRQSARAEAAKEMALWRVSLAFGFVFGLEDFLAALGTGKR